MQASTAESSGRFLTLAALAFVSALVATLITIRKSHDFELASDSASEKPGELLRIDDPANYFERTGFVQLVPPIRLPGRASGRNKTEIFVRIPPEAFLAMEEKEGRRELRFPPGAQAARVESVLRNVDGEEIWSIADVRATRFDEEGEWFQVYRPVSSAPHAPLLGVEWRRGEPDAQRRADDWIAVAARWSVPPQSAERAARKARSDNACGQCHRPFRPAAERLGQGSVHRGTDASGLFVPRTVFSDSVPLEFYASLERNAGNPSVSFICPSSGEAPSWKGKGLRRRPSCPEEEIPWGHWNAEEAVRTDRAHAQEVCASRRALLPLVALPERQRFAAFIEVCDLLEEP